MTDTKIQKRFLALGAGVQSSCLALMSCVGEYEKPDAAIFADTGDEPVRVYEWLEFLKTKLRAAGIPLHVVQKGVLSEGTLVVRRSMKSGKMYHKGGIPLFLLMPDGDKGMMQRRCTADYKIRPVVKLMKEIAGLKGRLPKHFVVEQWLGISTDEVIRMKPARDLWIQHRWPLIEMGMSREHCFKWMREHKLPEPPRSACVYCPYHSNVEWKRLRDEQPEDFQKAVAFEREYQAAHEKGETLLGKPFLHRSCKPLDEIDFDNSKQGNLFGNECEGMCGV